MTKCRQCNVTILDGTTVCPLCQCVVQADTPGIADAGQVADPAPAPGNTGKINEYPDVWIRQRKIKRVSNLILLAVIAASAVMAALNTAFSDSWWCLIPVAALIYAYAVFRLVFVSRKGYRMKVFVPLVLALVLLLIIDAETGFNGWSLNYVFPAGILLTDMIIMILMLSNLKNWQSYMIMQIIMIAVSCVPVVLWISGVITAPLLSLIALGITVFLFVTALITGDRTARGELRRRFHIR